MVKTHQANQATVESLNSLDSAMRKKQKCYVMCIARVTNAKMRN